MKHLQHYRMLMTTSARLVFYPDEVAPAAPLAAAPELPAVEEPLEIPETPPAGDPPKEDPPKEPEPKVEETPEAKAEREAAEEAAKVPEAYTLTAGEGVELDKAMVEQATPIFKELGLNNAQAQKVVDLYANTVLPEVAQTVQTQTLALLGMADMVDWAKQLKADKEYGGSKVTETLAMCAAGRDRFGTPELRALLETTRLGNHPEIVKFFAKVGKATGEDQVLSDSGGKTQATGASVLYGPEFGPK